MNAKTKLYILLILPALILAACGSPAAEAAPAASPMPAEPSEVVQDFWNALKAQDLETALALVSDDFTCRGSCYFAGKESLRSYLEGYLDAGFETEISDVQVDGGTVAYSWEMQRNGQLTSQGLGRESMQVENGMIVFWENLRP